jgi:hypothetical protein
MSVNVVTLGQFVTINFFTALFLILGLSLPVYANSSRGSARVPCNVNDEDIASRRKAEREVSQILSKRKKSRRNRARSLEDSRSR